MTQEDYARLHAQVLENTALARDDAIKQRDDAIKQRDDAIKQRDDAIKQRDDAMAIADTLRGELRTASASLAQQKLRYRELAELHVQAVQARADTAEILQALLRSRSWRYTRWLRADG